MSQTLKKAARLSVILFACSLLLSACNGTAEEKTVPMTNTLPAHLKALEWAKTADAEKDVAAAIAQKDFRLLVAAGRGERAPGIDAEQADKIKEKCGVKYIKGSTDVLKDQDHRVLLKKAYAYAGSYNQIMLAHCKID